MTLPTYNPEAKCPQCAHDEVGTRYMDDTGYDCMSTYAPLPCPEARPVCHYTKGPHHHRTCKRCGYRWAEAVNAPSMAMDPR